MAPSSTGKRAVRMPRCFVHDPAPGRCSFCSRGASIAGVKKFCALMIVAGVFSSRSFADNFPSDNPPGEVFATFNVEGEIFSAWIADGQGIGQAISLWQGTSDATIPNGILVFAPVSWNQPWSWYLDPGSVAFAESTLEECDGLPSYVESSGPAFGPRYCPWSGVMVSLQNENGIAIPRDPGGGPPVSPVPEPATFTLLLISLCWYLACAGRPRAALTNRKKRQYS